MNTETTKDNWTEVKKAIKSKWVRLNDTEIEDARKDLENLVSKLQKTYGFAKEKAEAELADFKRSLKYAAAKGKNTAEKTKDTGIKKEKDVIEKTEEVFTRGDY